MSQFRIFDVIVWGATGFTGRLVAEYLLTTYGNDVGLRWAIAGRNEDKLKQIRAELKDESIPILVADSDDKESLDELVARTKVICTTVGPYAKYGSKLVEACIEQGTDYCDLSGEPQWIRSMIDQHNDAAEKAGVRIVNCCGFDSIPSDLGVMFLQNEIKEKTGNYAQHIKLRLKAMSGTFSGGTFASMQNVLHEANTDAMTRRVLKSPYGLNPEMDNQGDDVPDLEAVVLDEDAGSYITPFLMAGINTKIVRRSHALSGFQYGKGFRYDEAVLSGPGFKGKLKGIGMALQLATLVIGKPGSRLRNYLDSKLPDPGEGPDKEARENGFFNFLLIGKLEDGTVVRGKVTGDRDPGYGSTSKMLGECAVCLAKDKEQTPEVAGLLTPSIAMGEVLLERLQKNAGLTFSIEE